MRPKIPEELPYEESEDDPKEENIKDRKVDDGNILKGIDILMKVMNEEIKKQNTLNAKNLSQMYFLEMGQLIAEQRMYDTEYIK
jgi:hypothetical protein